MALWVSSDGKGKQFDDGLAFEPGEDGFTRDLAEAHFGETGFDYAGTPNWHLRIEGERLEGQAAIEAADLAEREKAAQEAEARDAADRDAAAAARAELERAEQAASEAADLAEREAAARDLADREAAAKARIAQLLDPDSFARSQAAAAIEAEHEALAPFADAGEIERLDAVKEARLAALEPPAEPEPSAIAAD